MADFRCEKCGKNFNTEEALNMHNNAKHINDKKEHSKKVAKKTKNWAIIVWYLLIYQIAPLLARFVYG